MSAETSAAHPSSMRDESKTLFGRTTGLVAITAGCFAVGAYVGRDISPGWSWILFIAAIAALIGLSFVSRRPPGDSVALLFAFGFILGAAVAPTIAYRSNTDPQVLWEAGGGTGLFIAGFGALGYVTRRHLSTVARWLNWALLVLIGFGVVLVFAQIPPGALIYAVVGLVIFAGHTLYDFQRLHRTKDIDQAPLLAGISD